MSVHRTPRAAAPPTRSGAGPSDALLVIAARGGEEWAAEALYRRHAAAVNALAFRVMGRDDDVDDLVQEAFGRGFASLGRLKEPQAFGAWVRGILVRAAYVTLRRRRLFARLGFGRRDCDVDVDALASRAATPEEILLVRRVYSAVARLPADLRIALVLRRIDELPLDEIAALTDTSLATVKRRIARADELLEAATEGDEP